MTQEIEIIVPEAWEDVKLSQYIAYMKALKPYQGTEEYATVMYEKAINHFCDLSTDMLRKLPMENYNGIMHHMKELFAEGEQLPVVKKFVVGDTTYGFIPNLDSMTYGEYLDLSTYSKDLWANLPTFLSIIYRPIIKTKGDTYEVKPHNGTDQDVIDLFTVALTMDIVWGAIGFFTALQKDLWKGMATYSVQMLEKMKTNSQVVETLIKNGELVSIMI